MVEAGNVQVTDKTISMDCILDDRADEMFTLVLDKETLDIIENTHGERDGYVAHAQWRIRDYIKKGEPIPKRFTSMWY